MPQNELLLSIKFHSGHYGNQQNAPDFHCGTALQKPLMVTEG